ncbi:nucleotide sugar dehydrogenase [Tepidimonas taiwanensis]|uniref:UDP-N-acetyl-D-glucosamine 6-dehydrogenase n=1 Tax=Tepidimonas taiwanensis TaxID=307486 RepID=A0A554X692_9BURK|nr:nucleotide sugar dehydrogenase [Tepidimonas taiwanensis]TSE31349.1 UDP-N-acetyl-D-glucosamine 6-dehydrogenase [Tepidimonas taiwanensis]UBQ06134.1 nucleotide sugar dehydrogenase [Tepidimonas taiwanensis]
MHLIGQPIAVIGLGYVGLPLAVEFGKRYPVVGFDIKPERIAELRSGRDGTREVEPEELAAAVHLRYSSDPEDLRDCRVFIVTVPTPVDRVNRPDFTPLIRASETVGRALKAGDVVIYESTVYPGATEEVCVPILERESRLVFNRDFFCGYSPERINPGDKEHRLTTIKKVTSGSTPEAAEAIDALYASIITAGTHRASSIKVAEAAKVIENTQRDLNIALMNELAIIFDKLGIDTLEVLEAAGTKWNFVPFRPGLVGGHCIGVDPYYLTYKAEMVGYHPQVILAGRRINDGMASYIAKMAVQGMIRQGGCRRGDKVIVLGLTFKENCPDLRNSKVADLVGHLRAYGLDVYVHDPLADPQEALREYGIELVSWDNLPRDVSALVAAVSHRDYLQRPLADIASLLKPRGTFVDVKSDFDAAAIEQMGHYVWRL